MPGNSGRQGWGFFGGKNAGLEQSFSGEASGSLPQGFFLWNIGE